MQVRNLPFAGFGYHPWGSGAPGVNSPASGASGSQTGATASGSSSSNAGSSSSGIGSDLSHAVSNMMGSAPGNGVTSSVSELAVVRESETLKIQMADGAQVTIRMRAQGAAFGAAQTQADGSSSAAAAIFSSGQLQVAVSGNLSDADKQAISAVLSQVNSLATQFFSGDVQDAFAAASSLSVDPAEIAGFSLKLSYSSTLIQRPAASGPALASGAGAPGSSTTAPVGATPPDNTTAPTSNTQPTDATSDPTGAGAATSTAAPSTVDGSPAHATNTLSPQQIIINFLQKVMTTLGRGPGSAGAHSHLAASSRWKLHLLAQALPAYAQAQAGAASASQGTTGSQPDPASQGTTGSQPDPASQGTTGSQPDPASQGTTGSQPDPASQGTAPAGAPQGVTPAMASTPQAASNRYPTLQAAKLAADTLSQLAQ